VGRWVRALALALLALTVSWLLYRQIVSRWWNYQPEPPLSAEDREIRTFFLSDAADGQRFDALSDYFTKGFLRHATYGYARVFYAGAASVAGFRLDGLMGFARTAPLLAARAYAGRGDNVIDPRSGIAVSVVEILKQGILNGVSPGSPGYWGAIRDDDQRILEAADVARVLWLTREALWNRLGSADRERIASWLRQAAVAATPRTNWMLSPILIDLVLAKLGSPDAPPELLERARRQFDEYRRFYREDGWFFDPPNGIDYYNAWAITYELLWMHLISPEFEPEFVRGAILASGTLTAHLISPSGIPIMGRSVCYRTAVPVPVIAASFLDPERSGQARRALDLVWRYFIANGSLRDGALTQGYFESDPRILENYMGPGVCHWGLRSLVLALMLPPDGRFWTDAPAPLPVESEDFVLALPRLGWKITGRHSSGEIVIEIPHNAPGAVVLEPYTWADRTIEILLRKPHRPHNHEAKYEAREYSSARPFVLEDGASMSTHRR
jgi:hypothetical protein